MAAKEKFYITTPIYYPSGKWHLGHCYTTVYGDSIARFKRMEGYDVFYLTGTDEHGQKIEKRAEEAGISPKKFVDGLVANIKELWSALDISYDKFIRTTDGYHEAAVQKIFKRLYDNGDIYKSKYKGKYCTPCESFWTESQLKDGKCPDCGREVQDAEEESYFFRLSKYAPRVRELLTQTDFLQPESRVSEMVNNFIDAGLEDLAVSRTGFKWGVPVGFDKGHVIYVWVDALSNYITALGYDPESKTLSPEMTKYWGADLHLMAKEIVRFHAIIWPSILMALGLPLPKKIVAHGWMQFNGDKMSKSKGNVVDPFVLLPRYGKDSLRYYLLRAMPFGADGAYTNETFLTRINADLCNDLGNLVRRTMKMNEQYFSGKIAAGKPEKEDEPLIAQINALYGEVKAAMNEYKPQVALEKIFDLIGAANKYIDITKPWVLIKEGKTERLNEVLYALTEAIRIAGTLLAPFVPETAQKILASLKLKVPDNNRGLTYGNVKKYETVALDALFPRLDVKKELAELEKSENADGGKKEKSKESKKEDKKEMDEENGLITIDEFFRTQLRVAEVIACEKVEKADKLLKLTLKVGEETRTVVSGIAKHYTPEEMVGKRVVLVANLKPRAMRGIESKGMILCASEGDKLVLVSPESAIASGAEVC